ncbi:predicted protein [Arabidopsis lyrata subsp. lyrata]|uniref:Predicted protein n=1 Tax=Arabidopsis lyrata subsp. lyrata TaxID=81972 RepID=D7KRJ7_ARALL|nr:predicted protein [Arabidopsis lyrata subsp. lyrata]
MARYKLHLNVNDNSGETKLICFDNPAFFIVNLPASALLPAPFNESTAYTTIPDRIQKLIGQTFIFSVSVEQENIFEGLDTFKVNRVIADDLSITKTLHGKKIFAPK